LITARSQLDHSSITARSQLDHILIACSVSTRSPSTSYHLTVQVIQSTRLTAMQIPNTDDTTQMPNK